MFLRFFQYFVFLSSNIVILNQLKKSQQLSISPSGNKRKKSHQQTSINQPIKTKRKIKLNFVSHFLHKCQMLICS